MAPKQTLKVKDTTKTRDPAAKALAESGKSSPGAHHNRDRDVSKGTSRKDKHRKDWNDKEADAEEASKVARIALRVASLYLSGESE